MKTIEMHNLHIVRVKAESHENAIENAEEIVPSGYEINESYYYLGSYCKEDQTFSERFNERWFEKNEFLNNPQLFQDMLTPDENEINGQKVFENGVQDAKGLDLWYLSYYFRKKYERSKLSHPNQLDIWKDEFNYGSYSEYGLTDLETIGSKTYLLFIDTPI
jgi:hypothetical protein